MKQFFSAIILSLSLMLLVTACANLDKHIETIKPTARLLGTRLTNINFQQADLEFDVAIKNQNPFSLKLASIEYDLRVAEHSLVSGITGEGIKVKKSSTSTLALPVTLKFDDLKKISGELWESDQLAYQLNTYINIELPIIGNHTIPYAKKGELPVPKLPRVRLNNLKIQKLNLASAELLAEVEIDNPNAFDLGLKNFNYSLNINRQNWGKGTSSNPTSIPKRGKGSLNIPLKINLLSMGKSVYGIIEGNQTFNYQLQGDITMDTGLEFMRAYKLPMNISGTASVK